MHEESEPKNEGSQSSPQPSAGSTPERRNAPYSRASRRAHSHDTAHAEDEHAAPAAHTNHPLAFKGQAALLTSNEEVAALLERLRAAGSFAYDSEFIGELT